MMDAKLYTEGSIYYYENVTNTKKDYYDDTKNHDFIVSRPVYVIDSRPVMDVATKVNVLVITSSKTRIGIDINIDGNKTGKVLPYSIYSVDAKNLVKYLGAVSDDLKHEINDAIKYHLGFTDDKPNYLEKHEEYMAYKSEFVKALTPKAKVLYDFIDTQCKVSDENYVTYEEFYYTYKKRVSQNLVYERKCDLTRILNKIKEILPDMKISEMDGVQIIAGISIKGNIHTFRTPCINLNGVLATSDPTKGIDLDLLDKQSLLKLISKSQMQIYDKLDIVEKLDNSRKKIEEFTFKVTDNFNGKIMKRLLTIDVNIKMTDIKMKLKQGASPFEMNAHNQYFVYHLTNSEILECVDPKFFNKGKYRKKGISAFKRKIRQNIHWLFNKS